MTQSFFAAGYQKQKGALFGKLQRGSAPNPARSTGNNYNIGVA